MTKLDLAVQALNLIAGAVDIHFPQDEYESGYFEGLKTQSEIAVEYLKQIEKADA